MDYLKSASTWLPEINILGVNSPEIIVPTVIGNADVKFHCID